FEGSVALLSDDVIAAVSVLLATFQFASTALTVTLNEVPAVRAVGDPDLPDPVPAAAVSPGISSCSFANGPASTQNPALSPAVRLSPLVRVAVMTTPDSAFVYVTPLMVTELVPAVMVPVSVPPSVPPPVLRLSDTFVLATTLRVVPAALC